MRRLLTATAAVATTLIIAPAAYAHTGLERGSPGPGDTVRPGGELIALTFERIDPEASHEIALLDADEQAQPVGAAHAVDDTTVCARVDPLDVGIHAIAYSVTSPDGHLVRGTYEFEVATGGVHSRPGPCGSAQLAAPTAPRTIDSLDTRGPPLTVVWISLAVCVVVVGAAVITLRRRSTGPAAVGRGPDSRNGSPE